MADQSLDDEIADLTIAIKANPSDEKLEARIAELCRQHGDRVYELIADQLTAGLDGAYSQRRQDKSNQSRFATEIASTGTIPIVFLATLPNSIQLLDQQMLDLVSELIPSDFHRLPLDARLTLTESEVWGYFIHGYDVVAMAALVQQCRYTPKAIEVILDRAKSKVYRCPWFGWRTCLAEDIHRGKHSHPPNTVSWCEVLRDDD